MQREYKRRLALLWEASALILQCAWRQHRARVEVSTKRRFLALVRAVKGKWRRFTKHSVATKRYASTLLQRVWRGHRENRKYLQLRLRHRAAICIQPVWRGWSSRLVTDRAFQHRSVARFCQRIFRGYKLRERSTSVDVLIAFARGRIARMRYHVLLQKKRAAVLVQAIVRSNWARTTVHVREKAAQTIQSFVRDYFSGQMIAASALSFRDYDNSHAAAAVRIEACARGFLARHWASRLRKRLMSCDGLEQAKMSLQVRQQHCHRSDRLYFCLWHRPYPVLLYLLCRPFCTKWTNVSNRLKTMTRHLLLLQLSNKICFTCAT